VSGLPATPQRVIVSVTRAVPGGLCRTPWVDLGSAGDSGLVDPFSADGVGEHVEGGLVVFDYYVGMVGVSSSGHRRVDTSAIGGTVAEEESGVDGAAVDGVAGLRLSEIDMLGHVVGGQTDGAGASGDSDGAVPVDAGDGPVDPGF